MDDIISCPTCHTAVRPTDYFCFNCGFNLRPKSPSITVGSQISLYIKSALLPPMGIIWGLPYIKDQDMKVRIVGYAAMVITVGVILLYALSIRQTMDAVSTQMQQYQGMGL